MLRVFGNTYCWIFGATGKGHSAFLTTWIGVGAVEVDVQIPVVSAKGSTTLPLRGQAHTTEPHMCSMSTMSHSHNSQYNNVVK